MRTLRVLALPTAVRLLGLGLLLISFGPDRDTSATSASKDAFRSRAAANGQQRHKMSEAYGKLPISFEANQGQTDGEVKFLSRGSGYSLFLTSTELSHRLLNLAE